jgi:hypothetical protein
VISFALFFLWLVLEAARSEWRSVHGWAYGIGATFAASAVLLSKQSGALYLAVAPVLVLADSWMEGPLARYLDGTGSAKSVQGEDRCRARTRTDANHRLRF